MFDLEAYVSHREALMRQQVRDAMADDMSELRRELTNLVDVVLEGSQTAQELQRQLREQAATIEKLQANESVGTQARLNQQRELALAHDEIRSLKEEQRKLEDAGMQTRVKQQSELALAHDEINRLKEVQRQLEDRLDQMRADKLVQPNPVTEALPQTEPTEPGNTNAQKPGDEDHGAPSNTGDGACAPEFRVLPREYQSIPARIVFDRWLDEEVIRLRKENGLSAIEAVKMSGAVLVRKQAQALQRLSTGRAAGAPWDEMYRLGAIVKDEPRFIPATQFQGAKPGYEFTTGASGLGYYLAIQRGQ